MAAVDAASITAHAQGERASVDADEPGAAPLVASTRRANASEAAIRPARGGSLGLGGSPASALAGQFAARAQFGERATPGADYFVQANSLQLGDQWLISIMSETVDIDAPTAVLSTDVVRQPLTLLRRESYAGIGFRLLFEVGRTDREVDTPGFARRFDACMDARETAYDADGHAVEARAAAEAAEAEAAEAEAAAALSSGDSRSDDDARASAARAAAAAAATTAANEANGANDARSAANSACSVLALRSNFRGEGPDRDGAMALLVRTRHNRVALFAGGRLMATAFDALDRGDALGVAAELGVTWRSSAFSLDAGLFYTYLTGRTSDEGAGVARHSLPVHDYGGVIRVGYEGSASVVNGLELAPRAGVFYRASGNAWQNTFAAPAMSSSVGGFQQELGIYAGGHFLEGFSGLVSLSALVPYGAEGFDDVTWILTIAPSFAEPLDDPSPDEPAAPSTTTRTTATADARTGTANPPAPVTGAGASDETAPRATDDAPDGTPGDGASTTTANTDLEAP